MTEAERKAAAALRRLADENFSIPDLNISFSYEEPKPGIQKEVEADVFKKKVFSRRGKRSAVIC